MPKQRGLIRVIRPSLHTSSFTALRRPSPPLRSGLECAQQIGAHGDAAFDALQGLLGPPDDPASPDRKPEASPGPGSDKYPAVVAGEGQPQDGEADDRQWRENTVCAGLAPLLAGSVTRSTAGAHKNLAGWLRFVSERDDRGMRSNPRLPLEVALAQGFKYAANRCGQPPHANPQAYAVLTEQAREMLKRTSFWFSRLTLIQALCLLSLSGSRPQRSASGRDADYAALVTHWAGVPDSQSEHPFVAEARQLAVWVLETGQPERFMWIDEGNVACQSWLRSGGARCPALAQSVDPAVGGVGRAPPPARNFWATCWCCSTWPSGEQAPADRSWYLQRLNRAELPPCLFTGTGRRSNRPGLSAAQWHSPRDQTAWLAAHLISAPTRRKAIGTALS